MKENTQSLVSILMPVYNAEKYLHKAIESILFQTYSTFELLIFNDGSTDGSLSIIESFKDTRIKLYNSPNNQGHVVQLNKGIQLSSGKYIARMDADDIAIENRLEEQVHFLENNEDVAILGTQVELVDEQLNHIHFKKLPTKSDELNCYQLFFCPFIHPSVMIRSEVFKQVEYSPEFLMAEDYHLWVNLLSEQKGANLSTCLLKYRIHSKNYGNSDKERTTQLIKNIYRQILSNWKVPFTEMDLSTHIMISHSNQSTIYESDLIKIKEWILKIEKHLPEEISKSVFSSIVRIVWKEIFWKVDKTNFSSYWSYIKGDIEGAYSPKQKLGIIKEFSFPLARLVNKVF